MAQVRQALTYVEVDVPHCSLNYGNPPCGAHLGFADGVNEGPFGAEFDGSNDYLTRGANLTGVVDGKAGSLSCWLHPLGGNGTDMAVFMTSNARFALLRNSSNLIQIIGRNSAGTVILDLRNSLGTFIAPSFWLHVLASWNLATATLQLYINDVAVTSAVTATNANIDYTDTNFAIGADPAGNLKFNGRIAELWIDTVNRIDFSVAANRRKFITADLQPVFLGEGGALPTGTSPPVFMSDEVLRWPTNKGTGGGMTLQGELDQFEFGDIKCFNSLGTCQDRPNFDDEPVTLRFAPDIGYLPTDIDCFPFIKAVEFTPAIVSLGVDLGQRASLKVLFKDAPHSDAGDTWDKYPESRDYDDPFARGTFWGKFRSRNPFLRSRAIRLIRGFVGDALADMETNHLIIDSFDDPTPKGEFTISAKDPLKLADGDRALAPAPSNGFLVADISAAATAFTLSPAGIGNSEYPAAAVAQIGGKEIVQFTRVGDVCTFTERGALDTGSQAHDAQDRVQVVLRYTGVDVATIIKDLLVTYAGVPASYITIATWLTETGSFLGTLYSAHICEPTSVNKLIAELIEQAGLAVWSDIINQQIRLQVLRAISTEADDFTADEYLESSLAVKEQPDRRISRAVTYFAKINPLVKEDQLNNYRSMANTPEADAELAEDDYGSPAYKVITSRWIPAGGRSIADRCNTNQFGRYRDPPRRFNFDVMRDAGQDPVLGVGYQLEGQPFQDETGALERVPIQITSLEPGEAVIHIEAEAMQFFRTADTDVDVTQHAIIYDSNINNVNARTTHDSLYPAPVSGDTITITVNLGVIIGSANTSLRALDIGSWPAGVIVNLIVNGRIQGAGGAGGSKVGGTKNPGLPGGPALYTRFAINLTSTSGEIWGGGGGGGAEDDGSGGGGAGQVPGAGGAGTAPGAAGTTEAGGLGGGGGQGGDGGGPGLAGETTADAAGGAAGAAIDGDSFVTDIGGIGDIRGGQIN